MLPPLSTGFESVSPGITPALSLLRAHAPDLSPLTTSVLPLYHESLQVAARPCWKQALPSVISANLSLDACTHTPVVLLVLLPVSSQETSAFVKARATRQLHNNTVQRLPYGPSSRGCSDFVMFRPPGLLATQIAPTTMCFSTRGSRGFLRPRISRFVTAPSRGYASRPNRATDGMGTFTPLDSRPCWPLPRPSRVTHPGTAPPSTLRCPCSACCPASTSRCWRSYLLGPAFTRHGSSTSS